MMPFAKLFLLDPDAGSQTTLYCALQEGLEPLSGRYFSNCALQQVGPKGRDDALAKKLWEVSERFTDLTMRDWEKLRNLCVLSVYCLCAFWRTQGMKSFVSEFVKYHLKSVKCVMMGICVFASLVEEEFMSPSWTDNKVFDSILKTSLWNLGFLKVFHS